MFRRSLVGGVAHCAFWLIGIVISFTVMAHSEARIAYGLLTGWWIALYFGYITNISISSSVFPFLIYICTGIFAVICKWTWFYKGLPETITLYYVIILLLGAAIFVSPILINEVVRKMALLLAKKDSQGKGGTAK